MSETNVTQPQKERNFYAKVAIVGQSGTGKSYLSKTANHDTTGYVNMERKPLPFKQGKAFKYMGQPKTWGAFKKNIEVYGADPAIKNIIISKLEQLNKMIPCSGEYFKLSNWINTLSTIPIGNYHTLPIKNTDTDIASYLQNKLIKDIIIKCRLKPYKYNAGFNRKLILRKHWVDEFGNSLILEKKRIKIIENDVTLEDWSIKQSDMYCGLSLDKIFSKTLIERFKWAMSAPDDYHF